MRRYISIIVLSLCCVAANAGEDGGEPEMATMTKAKLSELEALPEGIAVVHSPETVRAAWDGREELKNRWIYQTTVSSLADTVTIVEFGCFGWDGTGWVFNNITKKPYSAQQFAEWYSCPGAKLVVGNKVSDPSNWSAGGCLNAGKARWYFIGTDSKGKRVKGEATVELLAEYEDPKS